MRSRSIVVGDAVLKRRFCQSPPDSELGLDDGPRRIVRAQCVIQQKLVPIAAYFIVQTALGIWLVHLAAGWFVVGAGRNGMEYSVLLIVCLTAVLLGKRG